MGKKTRNPNKLEKQAAEEARVAEALQARKAAEALQARRAELEKIVAAHKAQQLAEARAEEEAALKASQADIDEDTALSVGVSLEEVAYTEAAYLPEEDDEFEVIGKGGNNEDLLAGMADQAAADLNHAAAGGSYFGWIWGGK